MSQKETSLNIACAELSVLLDSQEWFVDAIVVGKSLEVIVQYMNSEILNMIPEKIYDYPVKISYSLYYDWQVPVIELTAIKNLVN